MLILAIALLLALLAWPMWTFLIPPAAAEALPLDRLSRMLTTDGRSVNYRYFLLRRSFLVGGALALVGSLWCLARKARTEGRARRLIPAFLAVVLVGQGLGFGLFFLFPEAHLSKIITYGLLTDSRKVPGFSVRKFFTVREGVTSRDEVIALMGRGRPGTTIPEARDRIWWYKGDWSTTGWWFRLHFDESDVVEKLDARYWLD